MKRAALVRLCVWSLVVLAIVLGARSLAYALAPQPLPLAVELAGQAGGPGLVAISLGSLCVAGALAIGSVWIATLALRERMALEPLVRVEPPPLRPSRLAFRALGLWLVACGGFVLLESYVHARSGLGWHGLSCLTGPVHRNAVPLLAALSLLASALAAVASHVLAWMRRTVVRLAGRPRLTGAGGAVAVGPERSPSDVLVLSPTRARGPPADRELRHPGPSLQRKERVCLAIFTGLLVSLLAHSSSWQRSRSQAAPTPMPS